MNPDELQTETLAATTFNELLIEALNTIDQARQAAAEKGVANQPDYLLQLAVALALTAIAMRLAEPPGA